MGSLEIHLGIPCSVLGEKGEKEIGMEKEGSKEVEEEYEVCARSSILIVWVHCS